MADNQIVPISSSLAKPMADLFRTGGFALSFGFAGLMLMIIALFKDGPLQFPLFVIGALLTFSCLAFFLYTSLRARSAAASVSKNLPLIDALQSTAYQAVELASVTQSYAFKHLEKIQRVIGTVAPVIEQFPVVGPAAKKAGLTNVAQLSDAIVAATDGTKSIVLDLQEAIRKGDLREIKKYGAQLEDAVLTLKIALRTGADA